MACVNFDCVYDEAHPVADLGGDVMLTFQNDVSYIVDSMWMMLLGGTRNLIYC